jgi:hypothetical protein
MTLPTVAETLDQLLTANQHFALHGKGTTNHCPMALVALARMGASTARLAEFFASWTQRFALPEMAPDLQITPNNWLHCLGSPETFTSIRRHFADQVSIAGPTKIIEDVLASVPAAPATGAFHAIIRLSYGIEAAHVWEIAAGLAAYVATNLPIQIDLTGRHPAKSVEEAWHTLSSQLGDHRWRHASITGRLRLVAADRHFQQLVPRPPKADLLDDLATAAALLYWRTTDFTALHMVTGAHALRVICPHLSDTTRSKILQATWLTFCAGVALIRIPEAIDDTVPETAIGWPDILRQATRSNDDHVIKMTYTCWQEDKRRANPLYQAAAARLVRHGTA